MSRIFFLGGANIRNNQPIATSPTAKRILSPPFLSKFAHTKPPTIRVSQTDRIRPTTIHRPIDHPTAPTDKRSEISRPKTLLILQPFPEIRSATPPPQPADYQSPSQKLLPIARKQTPPNRSTHPTDKQTESHLSNPQTINRQAKNCPKHPHFESPHIQKSGLQPHTKPFSKKSIV